MTFQVETILSIITIFASLAVTWGVIKSKVAQFTIDLADHKLELRSLKDRLESNYVSRTHFMDVVAQIREDHRELRDDVKHILALLTNDFRDRNKTS